MAAHRRSAEPGLRVAWKAKSGSQLRVHECETACAYAVTVLQNNIAFNAVAAFEQQYATALTGFGLQGGAEVGAVCRPRRAVAPLCVARFALQPPRPWGVRLCACRSVRSLPRALFSRSVRGRNDLRLTTHGRRVRALLVSRGMRSDVQCTDVGPACSLCVRIEQYGGVTPRCPRFVFRS